MKIPDLVDSVVNFVPNKCVDLAFRVVNDPQGTTLNSLSPMAYSIGLAAEAGIIGYAAGRLSNNGYIGIGAAAATVVASIAVKTVSILKD